MDEIADRIAKLRPDISSRSKAARLAAYRDRPVHYAVEVLGVKTLTTDQRSILGSLTRKPSKTLVKAGHEVGKTLIAAVAVNWWFDTRVPSVCLTTAPKYSQVKDILWKEVRRLRRNAGLGGFPGPKMPRLETSADHFAVGMTANSAEGFQGHHGPDVLVVFDEAVGVGGEFWEAAHTMAHAFLAIFNPTDTTSQAYQEETQSERPYTVLEMSQLTHPNVKAWLDGSPLPVPCAVKPWELAINLRAWSQPIPPDQARATDVQWPPEWAEGYIARSGEQPQWYRPGPLAEARILGRWPSQGTYGVWSDAAWQATQAWTAEEALDRARRAAATGVLPRVGLDVAVFGDDWTQFHSRCGPVSLDHEGYNGRDTDHTIGKAVQLADRWASWASAIRPAEAEPVKRSDILFVVDSGGLGGDLPARMRAQGLTVIAINAGTPAANPHDYQNKRSELWFAAAEGRATTGQLCLSVLPADVRRKLKQQAMAPKWKLDAAGRRVVEPKEDTKSELGRSPDDMDALNLAYYEGGSFEIPASVPNPTTQPIADREPRRNLFKR